ncbi:MAG: trypsin-like peptidase domain-containing protein [Acidiphilium sp.]|nr:trypsin-like peptidase domain-containing protein [Acidiphilium sp.]MDD4935510.1 trypsin-like peptidase domain-containing protein [Acidiphilium sp.]
MTSRKILIPPFFSAVLLAGGTAFASPPAPPAIAKIAGTALPAVVDIESIDPMKPKSPSGAATKPGDGRFQKTATEKADTGTLIVPPRAEQALGTGFFVSPKGYIVTNHHVIAGASEIKVTLHDGQIFTAKLIGADKKADLAVLKINTGRPLPYLHFGDSSKLDLGDWVVAIGNPFGLGFSVSAGVVSALHRDIDSGPYDNFIQTDAAINRGNSGGPMLDANGHVVGVDSAIYSPSGGSVGIGFAIPSSMVKPVTESLIAHGAMTRGWAGLRIEDVSQDMEQAWHLKSSDGVVVGGVVEDGPSAGKLAPADVITAINDHPIDDVHAFKVALAEIPAGQTARMHYQIGGTLHDAAITVAVPPKSPKPEAQSTATPEPPKPEVIAALGVGVMTHPGAQGVIIVSVDKDSAAARAGLHPDSLIEAVGPDFVTTPKALRDHLAHKHAAALLVDGPQGTSWISVSLGKPVKAAKSG